MKNTKLKIKNRKGLTLNAHLELPANQKPNYYAIFAHCFTCSISLNAVRNVSRALTQDNFEFYQAATLGDQTGLRSYRRERFTGKQSFVQSTDIRFNLRRKSSNFLPFNIGFYGGFDYGRVWIDDSAVLNASFNTNNWNTSVGGGLFISAYNLITANVSAFSSDDGLRLAFNLGFGF